MTQPKLHPAPPADGATAEFYHVEVWKQRLSSGQWSLYTKCSGLGEAQQEVRWFVEDTKDPSEAIKRFKIYEVKTTTAHEELSF